MKLLKAYRYVTFSGSVWGDRAEEHIRAAKVAKKLEDTMFADTVLVTEAVPDNDGQYKSTDYYKSSGMMVNEQEYQELKKLGVSMLAVQGIYQQETTSFAKVAFWLTAVAFVCWNAILLAKVGGVV